MIAKERLRVLILGGYGVFGGRLAKLLGDEKRLTLIVAGRSRSKAEAFAAGLASGAATEAIAFDREGDVETKLAAARPDLIIDATGPFQAYGADPYRLVKAALAQGVNYMDFADGADFVAGIRAFDASAKERSLFVLSGVSSFPVLTAAAVRALSKGLQGIERIAGGIAPSPYAGVGLNVIRALANYGGRPVELVRESSPAAAYALTESLRYTIAPPGRLPLHNTRFSLLEVPDLKVLPAEWPELRSVWMGAGPVPEIFLRALNGFAWTVRLGILPSLVPFARLFHWAANRLSWGEHRGGMFVEIEGVDRDGGRAVRSWHLLAEGGDGPFIPAMALEGIVRNCLAGRPPAPGARPATRELELSDYQRLFARRAIATGFRDDGGRDRRLPLYARILGDAWDRLPEPLRQMHTPKEMPNAEGRASVERGQGFLARVIAWAFGFPMAGENIPVKLSFAETGKGEIWRRCFGKKCFSSHLTEGIGRSDRLLVERFGAFGFAFALVVEDGGLRMILRRWHFLGVPLPLTFAPSGGAYETVWDGSFHFDVEISHPFAGLIVRYAGTLLPIR